MIKFIEESLSNGIAIHVEPPSTERGKGLYIIEAYSHANHARSKKCITDLSELEMAIRQVVSEVQPGAQLDFVNAAPIGCDDLV